LELFLKGTISLNDNGADGLGVFDFSTSTGSITLFGELEANDNDEFGILLFSTTVTFSIDDGASLSACGNVLYDDIYIGSGNSLTLVTGGTCTGSTGGPGTIIPASACGACPPPLI